MVVAVKRRRRNAIKREGVAQRYIWIVLGLLFVAFIAKMEAINFILAFPVGIMATVYVWKLQDIAFAKAHELADRSSLWVLNLIFGFALNYLYIYLPVPILAGIFSGFLSYTALNKLFILP